MTDISHNTLTLNGVEYVRKDSVQPGERLHKDTAGLPFAIVRCRNAGVHAGYVQSRSNGTVTLYNSRRLWRWWSAATLSELAMEGPLASKLTEQKYGAVLPIIELTDSDVCEIIPASETACKAIYAVQEWRNK